MCKVTFIFICLVLLTAKSAASNTTAAITKTTPGWTTTTTFNVQATTAPMDRYPCLPDPCRNGATCVTKKKKKLGSTTTYSYVCKCLPSFTGVHCETGPEGDCEEYCPETAKCTFVASDIGPRPNILADSTVDRFLDYVDEKFISIIFLYDDSEFCFCSEGKYGADCQSPCPKGHYGPLCVGHCYTCKNEDCSPVDGKCNKGCVDGFTGSHCASETVCLENSKTCRYGFCSDTPFGLDDIQTGRLRTWELLADTPAERKQKCICNDGYYMPYCNQKCPKVKYISLQRFGMNCKQPQRKSCDRCLKPKQRCSVVTGQCKKCKKGYSMPYCELPSEILAQKQNVEDKDTQVEPDTDSADVQVTADTVEVSVQVDYFTSASTSTQTGEDLVPEIKELVEVKANLASVQKMLREVSDSAGDWEGEVQMLTAEVERLKKEKEFIDQKMTALMLSEMQFKGELDILNEENTGLKSELAKVTELKNELERIKEESDKISKESASLNLQLQDSNEQMWAALEASAAAAKPVEETAKEEGKLKQFFQKRQDLEEEMMAPAKEAVKEKFGMFKGKVGGKFDALKAKTQNLKDKFDRDKDRPAMPPIPPRQPPRPKQQPTTETPLLIDIRKRRQSNDDEIRVEARMTIYVPSEITDQSDFEKNFEDAVKDSADQFQSDIIPSLKMDKDSVVLLSVSAPDTTSEDDDEDDVLKKTIIIYVIGGVVALAILTALVWAVYRTIRNTSGSNGITIDRSTQHSRFQNVKAQGRPNTRSLKNSGPVRTRTSSGMLPSVQSEKRGKTIPTQNRERQPNSSHP